MSKWAFLLVASLGLASCSLFKKGSVDQPRGRQVNETTAMRILEGMTDSVEWMEGRYNVRFQTASMRQSVKVTLRLHKDQAVWMSISPGFGLEVARLYMSPDSVIFMNKLNKTYFKGSSKELSARLKAPLDFQLFQDMFLAKPAMLYKTELNRLFFDTLGRWTLSNVERDYFLEALDSGKADETVMAYGINSTESKLYAQYWIEPQQGLFEVQYFSYENASSSGQVPESFDVVLKGRQSANVNFQLTKLDLNQPLNMNIRIPRNYAPM